MNSDDYFYDSNILEKIGQEFLKSPSTDILNGKVVVDVNTKTMIFQRLWLLQNEKGFISTWPMPPESFCQKAPFEKYGLFNTEYKICADFDWLTKVFNSPVEINFVDYFIAHFYPYGFSHKEGNGRIKETLTIVFKNAS